MCRARDAEGPARRGHHRRGGGREGPRDHPVGGPHQRFATRPALLPGALGTLRGTPDPPTTTGSSRGGEVTSPGATRQIRANLAARPTRLATSEILGVTTHPLAFRHGAPGAIAE